MSERSAIIPIYALCSFSNIGSIGIQIWGIGASALSHQGDFARLGAISNPLFIGIVNSLLTVNC
ncbi:nucleoside transporter C-terminal domain-containing protein [Microcoleus sp.]|uniref:nucleoside transporter C-terminal domain-containing protein n=1 Tax=Microcoleus sp. TaxID=44472 RepID=UPI00359384D1